MDACRDCGQPMRWAMTEKNRRIPLDPDPVQGGTVTVEVKPGGVVRATVHPAGAPPTGPRYTNHFTTCPNAGRGRRRSRRSR